jgi:hypothetical protein
VGGRQKGGYRERRKKTGQKKEKTDRKKEIKTK